MPRKKRTYKVVGDAPITVGSKTYHKGDEFDAQDSAVAFFLQIGAIKEVK